ncbi:MAG TPA: sterol desaturase family protein [Acetobacteraceae bacterium]|nr:sterol desaturase family protein [Acetobacteraceae bacterium]
MISRWAQWFNSYSSWWFVAIFVPVLVAEVAAPARRAADNLSRRWLDNFALYAGGIAIVYLLGVDGSGFAPFFDGIPNVFAAANALGGEFAVLVLGVLLGDFFLYVLHRCEHRVFLLWRFHSVHHTDQDMDATTGLRHHPIETAYAISITVALACLGAPLWVAMAYAALWTAFSVLMHANLRLPERFDRLLSWIFVTPEMHLLHHARAEEFYDSNYGNVFSLWDRAFGTYRRIPRAGIDSLPIGIVTPPARGIRSLATPWIQPFVMHDRRPDQTVRQITAPPDAEPRRRTESSVASLSQPIGDLFHRRLDEPGP